MQKLTLSEACSKEYISSNYSFKEGDIVRFKNYFNQSPKLVYIEKLYLSAKKEEEVKTTPIVKLPKRHHKKKDKKKSSKKLASDDLDYEPVFK